MHGDLFDNPESEKIAINAKPGSDFRQWLFGHQFSREHVSRRSFIPQDKLNAHNRLHIQVLCNAWGEPTTIAKRVGLRTHYLRSRDEVIAAGLPMASAPWPQLMTSGPTVWRAHG